MSYHGVQAKVAAKAADPAYTDEASTDGVTDIRGDVSRDPIERHKLGDSAVQEIKMGKQHSSFEFGGDWNPADFSALAERLEEAVQNGSEMDVALFPEGDAVPKVQWDEGKLESFSIETSLDGLITYAARGPAKSITVTAA